MSRAKRKAESTGAIPESPDGQFIYCDSPAALEMLVARIEEVQQGAGAVVNWNEKIQDPDNADRERQIDVLIRRDGLVTLVECRLRNSKADVTWIEELMGRRESLQADSVIAVSARGFTRGAIKKAEAYGIFVRELADISKNEVLQWGSHTSAEVSYLEYSKLKFSQYFRSELSPKQLQILSENETRFDSLRRTLAQTDNGFREKSCFLNTRTAFDVQYKMEQELDGEICFSEVKVSGFVRFVREKFQLPVLLSYQQPEVHGSGIRVEATSERHLEVIKGRNIADVRIDMSCIPTPINASGLDFKVDLGRVYKEGKIQAVGQKLNVRFENVKYTVHFPSQTASRVRR